MNFFSLIKWKKGEFFFFFYPVKHINYKDWQIDLYDPSGCLPGRLQNLDLIASPFQFPYWQSAQLYLFFFVYYFWVQSPDIRKKKGSSLITPSGGPNLLLPGPAPRNFANKRNKY